MDNITNFNPNNYGFLFAGLLGRERLNPLGRGKPISDLYEELHSLTLEKAFFGSKIVDQDMANACFSGLWLLFNFLEESHTICQSIETITGSLWHGIMHRREGDFFNSKYWFRRVGEHPIFPDLQRVTKELASAIEPHPSISFLNTQSQWSPFNFVDLVEACLSNKSPHELLCRQIQQCEWELLFDFCYKKALGAS
jgi:hypothetical protein